MRSPAIPCRGCEYYVVAHEADRCELCLQSASFDHRRSRVHRLFLDALEQSATMASAENTARGLLLAMVDRELPRHTVDAALDAVERDTDPSILEWKRSAEVAWQAAEWLDWCATALMIAVRALIAVETASEWGVETVNLRKLLQAEASLIRTRSSTTAPSPLLLDWWTDIAATARRIHPAP